MAKKIEYMDPAWVSNLLGKGGRERCFLGSHFSLILDSAEVEEHILLEQPYRLSDHRIYLVLAGKAVYRINFIDYSLNAGDFLSIPTDAIVEKESMTDDFAMQVLAISDMPGVSRETADRLLPHEVLHLPLDIGDWQRMTDYMAMVTRQLLREHVVDESVSHLVMSMMADASDLQRTSGKRQAAPYQSRGEELFSRFYALLRQWGMAERNIHFYASQLGITPNHLSAVVRQQSDMSVKDWFNRATVMEAKALLKYSTLMIYEIADRLHFPEPTAFNRYFKKQTGMTPLEYRET